MIISLVSFSSYGLQSIYTHEMLVLNSQTAKLFFTKTDQTTNRLSSWKAWISSTKFAYITVETVNAPQAISQRIMEVLWTNLFLKKLYLSFHNLFTMVSF